MQVDSRRIDVLSGAAVFSSQRVAVSYCLIHERYGHGLRCCLFDAFSFFLAVALAQVAS